MWRAERLLFAEPTEHGVRIGIEIYVVRVEVDIPNGRVFSTDRHVSPLGGSGSRKTNGCYLSHNSGTGHAWVSTRDSFSAIYTLRLEEPAFQARVVTTWGRSRVE